SVHGPVRISRVCDRSSAGGCHRRRTVRRRREEAQRSIARGGQYQPHALRNQVDRGLQRLSSARGGEILRQLQCQRWKEVQGAGTEGSGCSAEAPQKSAKVSRGRANNVWNVCYAEVASRLYSKSACGDIRTQRV